MKEPKIRAIVWGCGMMGQTLIRHLHEKGIELVGVLDRNPSRIGKDVGEILEIETSLGLLIRHPDEAEQVFQAAKANVCIICTRSMMVDLYSPLEMAAKHGVNAITTGEEAFYPWTTSPNLTQKLDRLAKEHNCTLIGSGFQDVFCGHLIATVAGATHRIDRLEVITRYNVNDYGKILSELHGVGLTVADFQQVIATHKTPAVNWHVNEWLCSHLGWRIRTQKQQFIPTTDTEIVPAICLDRDIPVGDVTGMKSIVTTETDQGPIVETQAVGKVYSTGEFDSHECSVIGEPSTTLRITRPAVAVLTCGTVVNRLLQSIDAPPGFQTTDRLPPPNYLNLPLHL
ncbi:dihydrodipicolinate reductase [Dolichospermum sp. LEGE 00240]|uniref:NAD(P)H-dependent amine dehydrogenase family protein n=1 Tax=Dolichospermum sp. LEGE 00240 TaxID=1828603 RepID=UPI001881047F|nr:dihydrodipicolinate reductase [Dolichospermum sp. LEGE 00240]MBE9248423.1 dihydrodipicolinate reductase [Dolichospermum sp. LEGE 00240]